MALKSFSVNFTNTPNTAPVGNTPLSLNVELTSAEAKVLRQIRDGYITNGTQVGGTTALTVRLLLQAAAASLALA